MSFQFYALYPSLSVAQNLAFPLYAEKLSRREIQKKVDETSRVLQLDGILNRLPGQLAEGEKQRVAVGRSIIRDPTCFLFDEPLSRLDVQLREEIGVFGYNPQRYSARNLRDSCGLNNQLKGVGAEND